MENYRFYIPARVHNFKSTEPDFDSRSPSFFGCISRSRRWRPRWLHLLFLPLQFRALFQSWLEGKLLFLPIDVESDFSSSNINVCICSAQEGSPKYEGCLHVFLHIKHYKIDWHKQVSYFYQNILRRFL